MPWKIHGWIIRKDRKAQDAKAKKSELVSLLDNAFNDDDTPLTDKQHVALDAWLPDAMKL